MYELRRAIALVVNEEIEAFLDAGCSQPTESCAPGNDWWNDCQVMILPNAADPTRPLISVIMTPGLSDLAVAELDAHGFKVTSHDPSHTACQFRPGMH